MCLSSSSVNSPINLSGTTQIWKVKHVVKSLQDGDLKNWSSPYSARFPLLAGGEKKLKQQTVTCIGGQKHNDRLEDADIWA